MSNARDLAALDAASVGGAKGDIFYENAQTVTTDHTLIGTKNAVSAGPVAVDTGVTVTVDTGATWSIV